MSIESNADKVVLKLGAIDDKIEVVIDINVRRFGFLLLAMLQARTPVDTGRLLQNWQIKPLNGVGIVAGLKIVNNLPYSGVVESGSPVGGKPWPSAGPLTLVMGGRVYSKQAPGGMIGPVLPGMAKDLAQDIYDGIADA